MNSLLCLIMLWVKLTIQHEFVMANLGLSVTTSHLLLLPKCHPLLQQTQITSIFTSYLLVLPIRSVHLLSCHRLEFRLGWVLRVCRVQCLHL